MSGESPHPQRPPKGSTPSGTNHGRSKNGFSWKPISLAAKRQRSEQLRRLSGRSSHPRQVSTHPRKEVSTQGGKGDVGSDILLPESAGPPEARQLVGRTVDQYSQSHSQQSFALFSLLEPSRLSLPPITFLPPLISSPPSSPPLTLPPHPPHSQTEFGPQGGRVLRSHDLAGGSGQHKRLEDLKYGGSQNGVGDKGKARKDDVRLGRPSQGSRKGPDEGQMGGGKPPEKSAGPTQPAETPITNGLDLAPSCDQAAPQTVRPVDARLRLLAILRSKGK